MNMRTRLWVLAVALTIVVAAVLLAGWLAYPPPPRYAVGTKLTLAGVPVTIVGREAVSQGPLARRVWVYRFECDSSDPRWSQGSLPEPSLILLASSQPASR